MKFKVMTAENGWVIEEQLEEGEHRSGLHAFGHDDSEEGQARAFADLLWTIKNMIGPNESRYSKHRVVINIEPGDKHEDYAAGEL
jgi:hypothetical protein